MTDQIRELTHKRVTQIANRINLCLESAELIRKQMRDETPAMSVERESASALVMYLNSALNVCRSLQAQTRPEVVSE